jgi:hypothetical protein
MDYRTLFSEVCVRLSSLRSRDHRRALVKEGCTKITVHRDVTPFSQIGTEISELPVASFLPQRLWYCEMILPMY